MYFILLPGANKAVYLWRPARVCLPRILTCDICLCRLQTARDATPVHPEAGSGRLQAGATATPTLCRPRWALTDCPGAAMVTQAITQVTPHHSITQVTPSITDTTMAGLGQVITNSPGLTRDSSTSDEEHPEPKTRGITRKIWHYCIVSFAGIEKFNQWRNYEVLLWRKDNYSMIYLYFERQISAFKDNLREYKWIFSSFTNSYNNWVVLKMLNKYNIFVSTSESLKILKFGFYFKQQNKSCLPCSLSNRFLLTII